MEEELYKELILELYRNPLNKKALVEYTCKHKEFNPSCGDEIEVFVRFDEAGKIIDIGHQGQGCAISQAAVSLLTDEMKEKTKSEIQSFTENQIIKMLGIPVSKNRLKCATLGFKALQKCL